MIYGQCRMSSGRCHPKSTGWRNYCRYLIRITYSQCRWLRPRWYVVRMGNDYFRKSWRHKKPLPGHLGSIFKNCSTPGGASAILYIQMQLYNFFTENVSLPWLKLAPSVACSLLLITGIAANSTRSWDNNHASHLLLRKLLEIEC